VPDRYRHPDHLGAADSKANGTVNVAAALLIAQCSVGLVNGLSP